ncbi:immunity protein Tsi6 family protein [Vibrio brasiliensis]|uniref:immunity protein Tsi6 family protein n=1 Tax=Vibrio brasiliensis TaxID=170652 RepID=UPI001EFDE6B5|nr:immunity protein Tsi6 family protein [Vibrio brasiliensis]MCG9647892.1 immunity protein Tsi6 family protein [Vibrio brasiliensis]
MSSKDISTIEEALSACQKRIKKYPSFSLLLSIERQIVYVRAVVEGSEKDKSRLNELTLGVYAVREFFDTDREFAELLVDVNDIANKLKY